MHSKVGCAWARFFFNSQALDTGFCSCRRRPHHAKFLFGGRAAATRAEQVKEICQFVHKLVYKNSELSYPFALRKLVTTISNNVPDIFAPADNVRNRELLAQDNLAMLARRTCERTARSGPITARQGACGNQGVPQSARSVMSVFSDASSLLTHRVDVSRETLVNAVISRMTTTFSSCMIRKADAKYFIKRTPQYDICLSQ